MRVGRHVFGLGAAALGIIGLVWSDFATNWQPVPPELPGYQALAYIAALIQLACGAGLQLKRSARTSACALAALIALVTIPWIIRIVGFPHLFGTWGGSAEQLTLLLAAAAIALSSGTAEGRERVFGGLFGVLAIFLGLNHFTALPQTADMVPAWIPPGQMFWAVATGIFYLAGGLGLVTGILDLLAARLLTAMMAGFSFLIWLPALATHPTLHNVLAGTAINVMLTGAAWVIADLLAQARQERGARLEVAEPPVAAPPLETRKP